MIRGLLKFQISIRTKKRLDIAIKSLKTRVLNAAKENALDYVKNILSFEKNNLRLMKKSRESDLNIEKSNLIYEIEFLKLKLKYDKKNLQSLIEQSITIAEKMNFTVGSSKSQLSKAKAMLREMLEKIMMT